jgi:hypothetical protein
MRIVAPSKEAYLAAAAVATSPRFRAVDGEGWVAVGKAASAPVDGGGVSCPCPCPRPRPRPKPRGIGFGRGENNDGFVVVASASSNRAATRGRPWWISAAAARGAPPPREADPTTPLDSPALACLDASARGGGRGEAAASTEAMMFFSGGMKDEDGGAAPSKRGLGLGAAALRWRLGFAEDADGVSVAERFKRACEEVDAERKLKREKNRRKGRNRTLNKLGKSSYERAMFDALDDRSPFDPRRRAY